MFALPQESRDFVRRLRGKSADGAGPWMVGELGGEEIVVAHTGIGMTCAAEKTRALLAAHRPGWLISAGFAGGLDPELKVGDIVVATNFSAPELLARAKRRPSTAQPCDGAGCSDRNDSGGAPRVFPGPLVTSRHAIECFAEKSQLARETGALAVDMETSAIAGECAKSGVPMLAVRVISDCAATPLAVPFACSYDLVRQRPRPLRLTVFLAGHPSRIAPFARFVAGLAPARRALTHFLHSLIEGPSA